MVRGRLPHTIVGGAHGFGLGEVEYLEAHVSQRIECVIYADIFVGEGGGGSVPPSFLFLTSCCAPRGL